MQQTIIAQNATHKAVLEHGQISIYLKEFYHSTDDKTHPEEFLYSIAEDMQDDVLAAFNNNQFEFINSAYLVEEID